MLVGFHQFIISYVDDLLIASENEEGRLQHLGLILERLQIYNVILNFKNANLGS